MDLSLDTSFDKNDAETLLVLAVQSFIQSNASIGSIEALFKHATTPWTVSIQKKFTTFLRNNIDEMQNVPKLLELLNHVIDLWSDTSIYTTMVYEESDEEGISLLTVLVDWMLTTNSLTSEQSMCVVSKIWQSLSQIQFITSWQQHPVDSWWIDAKPDELLVFANKGVQYIIEKKKDFALQSDLFDTSSAYCGYVSILSSLIQFNMCDWVSQLSKEHVTGLVETLLYDCEVWKNTLTNAISPDLLKQGLYSLNLLNFLQMKLDLDDFTSDFDVMLNSTSLIENILHVAFSIEESSNIHPTIMCDKSILKSLRALARTTVKSFSRGQGEAWACVLAFERHWGVFLYNSWSRLTSERDMDEETMEGLFLLHKLVPLQAQSAIISVTSDTNNSFADRLLSLSQQGHVSAAPYAAALLRLLLGDRQDKVECTGVTCTAWESLEQFSNLLPLQVQNLVSERNDRATNQTLLLITLDLLDLTIQHTTSIRSSLGTKELEIMIDMTNTEEVDECDFGEDTPQTHNLSRLVDESHIMLEESKRIGSTQRGMDNFLSIAAATVLARCGSLLASTLTPAMYSRIQRVVHECADGFNCRNKNTAFELFRRFLRLQIIAASNTNDDEEMIATTEWKRFNYYHQEFRNKEKKIDSSQKEMHSLLQRMKILETERDHAQSSIKCQALTLQKQWNRSRKFARTETARLIQGHLDERTKAEKKVAEAIKRMELAELRQEEAKKMLAQAHETENALKVRVEAEKTRVEKIEKTLRESNERKQEDLKHFQSELQKVNSELQRMQLERNEAVAKIDDRESELQRGAKAYTDLKEELDSAYEKLVCLAQIYEFKEEEAEEKGTRKERDFHHIKRKLQKEIQHNDELEGEMDKLQRENGRLMKKLERSKDKLEQQKVEEQNERAHRKQIGPVSYINSLHCESQRRMASSKESQKSRGKENSYYSSSSRSRGKRYMDS